MSIPTINSTDALPANVQREIVQPAFAKNDLDEEFLGQLNAWLKEMPPEARQADPAADQHALVYIVGAPRSGTTLLSQLASKYLEVGYINNLIARFWARPDIGIRLSQVLLGHNCGEAISLASRHGVSEGISGPHEFGYFWSHWFRLDKCPSHHLSEKHLSDLDAEGLKDALQTKILASFGMPVVFKNVICGFHASFLTHLHPQSLFVHIHRRPEVVARSILKARFDRYGAYSNWWSLKPSTFPFEQMGKDPVQDVVKQVRDCRDEIDTELNRPGVRRLDISYEDLCLHPPKALQRLVDAVQAMGGRVALRGGMPDDLQRSDGSPLPAHMAARLCEIIGQSCVGEAINSPVAA